MKASWLDRSPLPMGVARDGRFVYVNDTMAVLLGVPREALVGQPFIERIAPEDRDRVGERHVRRSRGEAMPESYELTILRGDGERRTVELWAAALGGGEIAFQLHDRTGRALRQEKVAGLARLGVAVQVERTEESVFAAVARGLIELDLVAVRFAPLFPETVDRPVRIIAASAPGDRLVPLEAALGGPLVGRVGLWSPLGQRGWREGSAYLDDVPFAAARFLGGEALDRILPATRAALPTRGVALRIDVGGQPADAMLLMADWLLPEDLPACRLFGAQVSAALEAGRLVADLRRSYADLARTQAQLVERERLAAIGELSAVVAHEVRNPLGVLFNSLGALRKLLGADPPGATGQLLTIMEEESARLNHIVRDLLDFARPTMPELARERIDVVVEEAALAALGEARGRVTLVREIGEVPPVPMDARLVRQAVLNVVDNAAQAMPQGGTLTLRLAAAEIGRARFARVEVEDTGPGIAPDVEPRIFEPFFTTRASGTGLGLAVVKRIVDSHRGQLRVTSTPGRGTTFAIWLPLDEEPPHTLRTGESTNG